MSGARFKIRLGLAAICLAAAIGAAAAWFGASREATARPLAQTTTATTFAGGERGQRPHLWVLSVGVSAYRDPALRLEYAAADARDFAAALQQQANGPVYDLVHTRVLTDTAASRDAILEALDGFLGQASPVDVAVIFLAGHGVRADRGAAHYFLTAAASPEAPHIAGVDMGELRRQILRLHRNIPRMVVVLDTCHAGAVTAAPSGAQLGADLSSGLAPVEGLYILTSASAGQRSLEVAARRHGAFTAALLDGLQGGAARNDGLITVLGLANHAIRQVEELTDGRQRPYISIVGEDLAIAADPGRLAQVTPPPLPTPAAPAEPERQRERIAIGDFEYFGPDAAYEWMHRALSQDVLTAFSEIRQLDVYDETMLRFVARDAPDTLEAAQRAGVGLLVRGAYWVQDRQLSISAQVQSVRPLQVVATARARGPVDKFAQLTGQVMLALLDQLSVDVPAPLGDQLRNPGTSSLTARKLLTEAESGGGRAPRRPERPIQPGAFHAPPPSAPPLLAWLLDAIVPPSFAQTDPDAEAQLRVTLEGYRQALEDEDLDALRRYYADFPASQAAALDRYFENAENLRIELSDVRVAIIGDEAAVSFTRHDRFTDRERGEPQDVRVRVTKRFAFRGGQWIILNDA
ncbi:caspase family protein [bacterium]|nr:caspase family protein [bacterium]